MKVATFFTLLLVSANAFNAPLFATRAVGKAPATKAVAKKKVYEKEAEGEELLDKVGGNVNSNGDKYKDATTNFWGQTVSKKEARGYDKAKKKGDVATMRKILQIPVGKVMPGYEELGDGKTKK